MNKKIIPIKPSVIYLRDGLIRQRKFTAATEEDLLNEVFMFHVDNFPAHHIDIKQVHYHGQVLRWNDFLAHNHFAKGRISFEQFRTMCLDNSNATA